MIAFAFIILAGGWLLLYSGFTNRDPREELSAALRGNHAPERGGKSIPNPPSGTFGYPGSGTGGQAGALSIIGRPYQGTHRLGNWESDNAVDVAAPIGTELYAPFNGVIVPGFGWDNKGGWRLHLRGEGNARGMEIYLAHLSGFAIGTLLGARVKEGDLIAYSGDTGNAKGTTPHLHMGALPPLDPFSFVNRVFKRKVV